MKIIIIILLYLQIIHAFDLHLIELLLKNDNDLSKLEDAKAAIKDSETILHRIVLTKFQKQLLWNYLKDFKQASQLNKTEIMEVTEFLSSVPEDNLYDLARTNWDVVKILGQVKTFSQRQVSVIANAIITKWGKAVMKKAVGINELSGLICGFNESLLSKISHFEFKQIDSSVFNNLYACSKDQLKALYDQVVEIYGVPQLWTVDVVKHVGMVILSLSKNEIRSIRPVALKGINLELIVKKEPRITEMFSPEQFQFLTANSKMIVQEKVEFISTNSANTINFDKFYLLMCLLIRLYLLLVC